MGIQFSPLSNDFYQIPKAQILFQPNGTGAMELLGDADDVTVNVNVDQTDRYSNEYGKKTLVDSIVNLVSAELKMTLVQLSDRNRALSMMSGLAYDAQSAVTDHLVTIASPDHTGKAYKLDHFDIDPEAVTVTDSTMSPIAYVEGTHYKIDTEAGIIQLIAKPVSATGSVKVTYDTVTITADDLRANLGIGSDSNIRGKIIIRGTNDVGPQAYVELHDVQLRPSKERAMISDTDLATLEITGAVFADPSQPSGFELGRERSLLPVPA